MSALSIAGNRGTMLSSSRDTMGSNYFWTTGETSVVEKGGQSEIKTEIIGDVALKPAKTESTKLDTNILGTNASKIDVMRLTQYLNTCLTICTTAGVLSLIFSLVCLGLGAYSATYIVFIISLGFGGLALTVRREKMHRVHQYVDR